MKRRTMVPFLGRSAILLLLLLTLVPPAGADVIIEGSPEFIAQVEACFEKIQATGGSAAATLNKLLGAKNKHVIKKSTKKNSTTPENGNSGPKPDGTPGTGSGSTVTWDPGYTDNYKGGDVARDPCAALFHELVHSGQCEMGTADPAPGENGIPKAELGACTEENKYRKKNGLPQRKKYDGVDLPPSTQAKAVAKEVNREND